MITGCGELELDLRKRDLQLVQRTGMPAEFLFNRTMDRIFWIGPTNAGGQFAIGDRVDETD